VTPRFSLSSLFQAFLLRRAAPRYASRLSYQIRRDYGATEYYTDAQVRAAIRKSGLPRQYVDLGLAAFLPEDGFRKIVTPGADYQSLRLLFRQPIKRQQPAFEPAPENLVTPVGYGSDHHGSF
jgi:hypothetical protein